MALNNKKKNAKEIRRAFKNKRKGNGTAFDRVLNTQAVRRVTRGLEENHKNTVDQFSNASRASSDNLDRLMKLYSYDDVNEGRYPESKSDRQIADRLTTSRKVMRAAIHQEVDNILGQYGNQKITNKRAYGDPSIAEFVAMVLEDHYYEY